MNQRTESAGPKPFWKRMGEGIIYTKCTPHGVLRDGQVTLPKLGTVFAKVVHSYAVYKGTVKPAEQVVTLDCEQDGKVVAKLRMSGRQGLKVRDAEITIGKAKTALKAVVTAQEGPKGHYLRVYMPEHVTPEVEGPRGPSVG